jgi:2-C-methyl-D-erythritol 4-phosphate cytidylyltransferase / 2-C-methyl-D-erythritol 2,4-cyclodiphosphate synthase
MKAYPMKIAALIVAAGKGSRAGGGLPKQYQTIGDVTLLGMSVKALLDHVDVDHVLVVTDPSDASLYHDAVSGLDLLPTVSGGQTRQASVFKGLEALVPLEPDIVLIHDGARPFVSPNIISDVIARIKATNHGVIPALPVADTLKRVDGTQIMTTTPRDSLVRAQTPQGFPFRAILAAHDDAKGLDYTDDAGIAVAAGLSVDMVAGSELNFKITSPDDLTRARTHVHTGTAGGESSLSETRTGMGFDVHRFQKGAFVTLCGVDIPHDKSLAGHSDADVAMHAVCDALYGAIGSGDIGDHFPASSSKWKDAPSRIFLEHAAKLVGDTGGRIVNVDITIICEFPKIGPYRGAMRESVAGILTMDSQRISVKATTSEKLGFTGRGEGIAAQAIATIVIEGTP